MAKEVSASTENQLIRWLKDKVGNTSSSNSGVEVSDSDLAEIMKNADKDSDGNVSAADFLDAASDYYKTDKLKSVEDDFEEAWNNVAGIDGDDSSLSNSDVEQANNGVTAGTQNNGSSSSSNSQSSVTPANITGSESVSDLTSSRSNALSQLTALQQEKEQNAAVNDAKEAYDEAIENMSSEDEEVQAKIEDIQQRKSENDTAISDQEQIISGLNSDLNSLVEPSKADYTTQDEEGNETFNTEEYESAVSAYEEKKADLEEQLAKAEQDLAELEQTGSEIDEEITELLNSEDGAQISNKAAVLEAMENLKEAEEETAELDENIAQLQANVAAYDNAIEEAKTKEEEAQASAETADYSSMANAAFGLTDDLAAEVSTASQGDTTQTYAASSGCATSNGTDNDSGEVEYGEDAQKWSDNIKKLATSTDLLQDMLYGEQYNLSTEEKISLLEEAKQIDGNVVEDYFASNVSFYTETLNEMADDTSDKYTLDDVIEFSKLCFGDDLPDNNIYDDPSDWSDYLEAWVGIYKKFGTDSDEIAKIEAYFSVEDLKNKITSALGEDSDLINDLDDVVTKAAEASSNDETGGTGDTTGDDGTGDTTGDGTGETGTTTGFSSSDKIQDAGDYYYVTAEKWEDNNSDLNSCLYYIINNSYDFDAIEQAYKEAEKEYDYETVREKLLSAIVEDNGIEDANIIYEGQEIKLADPLETLGIKSADSEETTDTTQSVDTESVDTEDVELSEKAKEYYYDLLDSEEQHDAGYYEDTINKVLEDTDLSNSEKLSLLETLYSITDKDSGNYNGDAAETAQTVLLNLTQSDIIPLIEAFAADVNNEEVDFSVDDFISTYDRLWEISGYASSIYTLRDESGDYVNAWISVYENATDDEQRLKLNDRIADVIADSVLGVDGEEPFYKTESELICNLMEDTLFSAETTAGDFCENNSIDIAEIETLCEDAEIDGDEIEIGSSEALRQVLEYLKSDDAADLDTDKAKAMLLYAAGGEDGKLEDLVNALCASTYKYEGNYPNDYLSEILDIFAVDSDTYQTVGDIGWEYSEYEFIDEYESQAAKEFKENLEENAKDEDAITDMLSNPDIPVTEKLALLREACWIDDNEVNYGSYDSSFYLNTLTEMADGENDYTLDDVIEFCGACEEMSLSHGSDFGGIAEAWVSIYDKYIDDSDAIAKLEKVYSIDLLLERIDQYDIEVDSDLLEKLESIHGNTES